MSVFHHQVFIARAVEAVFKAVADVRTHSLWQEGVLETQADDDNSNRVGARGVEVRRMFGRTARFPYEITAYDPPHTWGFRALEGPIRPSAVLSFKSQASGTLVESELRLPGLLGFVVGGMMLRQQRRNYSRLKDLLETGKL
jgi:uncharacterized protein YndB with AHSA1/START domain